MSFRICSSDITLLVLWPSSGCSNAHKMTKGRSSLEAQLITFFASKLEPHFNTICCSLRNKNNKDYRVQRFFVTFFCYILLNQFVWKSNNPNSCSTKFIQKNISNSTDCLAATLAIPNQLQITLWPSRNSVNIILLVVFYCLKVRRIKKDI